MHKKYILFGVVFLGSMLVRQVAAAAPSYTTTQNLFINSGFEDSAQFVHPVLFTTTSAPLAGAQSARAVFRGVRTELLAETKLETPVSGAKTLTVNSLVRSDIKGNGTAQLCGIAVYSDKKTSFRCATLSTILNKKNIVKIVVPLNTKKTVTYVQLVVRGRSAKEIHYTFDSVSAFLSVPKQPAAVQPVSVNSPDTSPVPSPAPTPAPVPSPAASPAASALTIHAPVARSISSSGIALAHPATAAAALTNGNILFLEGESKCDESGHFDRYAAEVYNPATHALSATSLLGGTVAHLLPNGLVLVRGFKGCTMNAVTGAFITAFSNDAKLYNASGMLMSAASSYAYPNAGRQGPEPRAGILLKNGTIFFSDYGGQTGVTVFQTYNATTDSFTSDAQTLGYDPGAPILEMDNGKILLGSSGTYYTYDPATKQVSRINATVMFDGQ